MEKIRHPRLTEEHLGQIRASVDWQAVFSGLGLQKCTKRSKDNDWWAHSPFHQERTPSFHMGPGGIWYDFSIGEGGGALELIQRLQGINCYRAGRYLIENGWAQCSLPNPKPEKQTEATKQSAKEVIDKTEPLNPTIRQDLIPLTQYHDYLAERGLSEETCQQLGIGFLAQGRSPLRGRVIFQLRDARVKGKQNEKQESCIISHIGRAVSDDQQPKYLFYEGFHKSAELLGQDRCWLDENTVEQIKNTGHIILTEGPFDWAKAIEAGILNVLASFGSNLSELQAEKLKALCSHHGVKKILIAFDRDDAGSDGATKAQALLQSLSLQASIWNWEASLGKQKGQPVYIPDHIHDLADFKTDQLVWLRQRGWI